MINTFFHKVKQFLDSRYFFLLILFVFVSCYGITNFGRDAGSLSSDVWGYQFLELQERYNYWDEVPPSYNQSELYVAFPLLYALNPGLEKGMMSYHILAIFLIVATYLISGLVTYRLFKSWFLATLGGLLPLIPRFIFPTRIGLLDLGAVRGNVFAAPFYFLLSYYWIIYGISDRRKNIGLAIVAGVLMYLYPPAGLITVGTFILAALFIHRKKYIRQIVVFVLVYSIVTLPFWINHFVNPNTGMLDESAEVSSVDLQLQSEIVQYKFRGSGFLSSIDIAEFKRSAWDESLLLLLFVISLWATWKYRDRFSSEQKQVTRVSLWFTVITCAFIVAVEIVNMLVMRNGYPPVFVDHLRPMRTFGFVLIMQTLLVFHFWKGTVRGKIVIGIATLILIFAPIRFAAPAIRPVVRALVPDVIRQKYNLAPVVAAHSEPVFASVDEMARWSREHVPHDGTKVFVFDDMQREFQFKIMSRLNTTLTGKEGNLWVTSGFDNSKRWYEERSIYASTTQHAVNFGEIVSLAKKLQATHILVPRGKWLELYEAWTRKLPEVHANADYRLLKITP